MISQIQASSLSDKRLGVCSPAVCTQPGLSSKVQKQLINEDEIRPPGYSTQALTCGVVGMMRQGVFENVTMEKTDTK